MWTSEHHNENEQSDFCPDDQPSEEDDLIPTRPKRSPEDPLPVRVDHVRPDPLCRCVREILVGAIRACIGDDQDKES